MADERRYLHGPIIYHGAWGVDALLWLVAAVPGARLLLIHAGERELASLEECLLYLQSASLDAPLAPDYAHLFFWLAQELLPCYGRAKDEPVWQMLGERAPFELTAHEQDLLRDLRVKIRRAVVKHAGRLRQILHGESR